MHNINDNQVSKNPKNNKDKGNEKGAELKEKRMLHYTAPTIYICRSYNCLTCHF